MCSHRVTDQILHPYKTTDKIMQLYIFVSLGFRQEYSELNGNIPKFNLLLTSSYIKFVFATAFSNDL